MFVITNPKRIHLVSCLGIGKKDVHELLMKEMFKITSLEASCPAQGTPPPHGSFAN